MNKWIIVILMLFMTTRAIAASTNIFTTKDFLDEAMIDPDATFDLGTNKQVILPTNTTISGVTISDKIENSKGSNQTVIVLSGNTDSPATVVNGNWITFRWLAGGSVSSVLGSIIVPVDMSLADDVELLIVYKPNQAGTGPSNVVWQLDTRYTSVSETSTGALAESFVVTQTISIAIHTITNVIFTLDETLMSVGDIIQIEFKRLGADEGDTFDKIIGSLQQAFLRYQRN